MRPAASLRVHTGVAEQVQEELEKRGHDVDTTDGPIASPVMIYIDHNTGTIYAAGDPHAGRHAAAIN